MSHPADYHFGCSIDPCPECRHFSRLADEDGAKDEKIARLERERDGLQSEVEELRSLVRECGDDLARWAKAMSGRAS